MSARTTISDIYDCFITLPAVWIIIVRCDPTPYGNNKLNSMSFSENIEALFAVRFKGSPTRLR